MALLKSRKNEGLISEERFAPIRLSSPRIFFYSMLIFLVIVGFVAAILYRQISSAFGSNPGLNGLIIGVLLIGILLAFGQVVRLFREVRWTNSFLAGTEASEPVLLAPMKALFSRSSAVALSPTSMRSILDSIANRLDESRDISRYLIGLLIFLGLLGTFWGLLQTIGSISSTIQSLNPGTGNTNDMLNSLKEGLSAPLNGMGTAFSSSLFGLSGSLVLGFLDLQAGRAQTRFYTELENWLSTVTDLSSDLTEAKDGATEELRVLASRLRTAQETGGSTQRSAAAMTSLAEGISGLVKSMRQEQQMMRDWVEAQSDDQKALRKTLEEISITLKNTDKR